MPFPSSPEQTSPPAPLVLIVDDDADTRTMLSVFLERSGFAVVTAGDGEEALSKVAVAPPDVVVTDVVLPRVDGLTLCRRIKGDERTARTPVIAVTGYLQSIPGHEAHAAVFDAFLPKPCPLEDLLAAIRNTIDETARLRNRSLELRQRAAALRAETEAAWAKLSQTLRRVSGGS